MERKKEIFKYPPTGRRVRRATAVWFFAVTAILFGVWYFWGEGGYTPAWAISLAAALLILCLLSIPRRIEVDDAAVEIRCVVEITRLPVQNICSARRVGKGDRGKFVPLIAGFAFFGYYGYYFDLRKKETVKLYCTDLADLVEITDIYEKRYYVNTAEPDRLVEAVNRVSSYYPYGA